jgi:hypothetical protein
MQERKEQATPTGVETFSYKTWTWSNGKQKASLARDTKILFVHAAQLNLLLFLRQRELKRCTELIFLNLLRAQESIPPACVAWRVGSTLFLLGL